jgi:hypothetical protein
MAAEAVVRRELPNLSIAVPSKGVGIHEPFPTAGEDNAAIDRSVLVTVELLFGGVLSGSPNPIAASQLSRSSDDISIDSSKSDDRRENSAALKSCSDVLDAG